MNSEQWEEELRRKLNSYEESAPDAAWQKLNKALAKRRTVALWRRSLAAAATIVLLAGAGWVWFSAFSDIEQPCTLGMEAQNSYEGENKDRNEKPVTVREEAVGGRSVTAACVRNAEVSPLHNDIPQEVQVAQTTAATMETEDTPKAESVSEATHTTQTKRSLESLFNEGYYTKKERRPKLTAKAYMGNSAMGYDSRSERTTMLAAADTYSASADDMPMENGVDHVMAGTTPDETTVSHDQPIRYGLSLRYELSDRWSIETGLTYSYLRSELTSVGSAHQSHTVQKLHYVGIPLTISYSLWRNRHANVYISAGTTIEKMVSGRAEEKTYGNEGNAKTANRKLAISQPQFSVGCSLGAEYLFSNNFGAYAEPGVSYYFDNNSRVPTIYSDKPLNLSLNIGLRMNIK